MATNKAKKTIKFEHRLVLFNWMLDRFGASNFNALSSAINQPELEGFTEEGNTKFIYMLRTVFTRPDLTDDDLLTYDNNIVRHWKRITEKRNHLEGLTLNPKYFQYLTLLFTEIYLDKYFTDQEKLLSDLNAYADEFNGGTTPQQVSFGSLFEEGLSESTEIKEYVAQDLKKLALWCATGSGKTLLMHINILQYRHYLNKAGNGKDLNKIILLTPNEGLSKQHRDEFALSGMEAELFNKDAGTLFSGHKIEIIDIHKLKDKSGDKTVAIDSFEGKNLVLVDEGHRGTTSSEVGEWMTRRNQLCSDGFSFEYSATFGQAMKATSNKDLPKEYSKCILFDYSYKYFYNDGYGKEYRILNLDDNRDDDFRYHYLTACLLAFYQQLRIYEDKKQNIHKYLIEKPLWIFVGSSVTKSLNEKDKSDIIDILLFLGRFVQEKGKSIKFLNELLKGASKILDENGSDIFSDSFTYISELVMSGEEAYAEILKKLFNAEAKGTLHVSRLKGSNAEGEVSLKIGEDNEPFGVINVGDASGLCKLCEDYTEHLVVSESDFNESLFRNINETDSKINILVGAKKFTEGWNSWRVSTMGLMNIGKSEGSQIIQLFGRGVRLKGYEHTLKRSRRIPGLRPEPYLERLETLNVFGIKADYMKAFKEYLEEEGLASKKRVEVVLPVIKNLGTKKLKIIKLKDGINFKKDGTKPTIGTVPEAIKKRPVVIDWYPKVQSLSGIGTTGTTMLLVPDEVVFGTEQVAFLDIEKIYFELQKFKNEKSWYNFNIDKNSITDILLDNSWYSILIPKETFTPDTFDDIKRLQDIASALIKKYCERLYNLKRDEWEKDFREYRELGEDDDNFLNEYRVLIEESRNDIITRLEEIKDLLSKKKLSGLDLVAGFDPIIFDNHLYQPLFYIKSNLIEVKPVTLNEGEKDFVLDLKNYCSKNTEFFKGKELYLLRNMSRGRGLGFFEAGNFYPDFIMWLIDGDKQYINFIDPKGLRNISIDDPKIEFHKTIKDIESSLKIQDPNIILNSFIVTPTPYDQLINIAGTLSMSDLEDKHVFFQIDDRENYIEKLLDIITI